MKRGIAVVGVLALLVVATAVYLRVGSTRMENACTADPPGGRPWKTAHDGWSWSPPGFACFHDGERQWTSLWPDD